MKGMRAFFLVMLISVLIAAFWNSVPFISGTVHFLLDPSFGYLLGWKQMAGFFIIIFIINFITTLVHKFATDQEAIKSLRQEQKDLRGDMQKYKGDPEKVKELSKKQMEFIPKSFELSGKSMAYTAVPFILFFRWFDDYFAALGDPKIFLGFGWFWTYLIFSIILSLVLRKILKVH